MNAIWTETDNELIAQTLGGDNAAFGQLVMRYQQLATGVAYRICGDLAMAEDVAQLTFIRIWEKLGTYRPEGNFKAWLCRIAANLTIDTLRKQKPAADIDDMALADPGHGPERSVVQQERAAAVRAALMRLPTHSRAVLVLREYEGFSYHEIANALDIPLGTVKSRINDARRRLQEELRDLIQQESC